MTWSELSSRKDSQEGWVDLDYCPLTSQQACDERKLLFASDDCPLLSSKCAIGTCVKSKMILICASCSL